MKKYSFSLEKVLEYDTFIQNKETDILCTLKNEYNALKAKHDALQKNYELSKARYQKCCEEGMPLRKAVTLRLFIEKQRNQLNRLEVQMAEKRRQIEAQINRLLEVTKDKRTIEKLKEGSIAQYKAMMGKHEEVQVEEFIANQIAQANASHY